MPEARGQVEVSMCGSLPGAGHILWQRRWTTKASTDETHEASVHFSITYMYANSDLQLKLGSTLARANVA